MKTQGKKKQTKKNPPNNRKHGIKEQYLIMHTYIAMREMYIREYTDKLMKRLTQNRCTH